MGCGLALASEQPDFVGSDSSGSIPGMAIQVKPKIERGDLWTVRFDPSEGDEIQKVRPAVVMTDAEAGRMDLHIVVPLTAWQGRFKRYFWMVKLTPSKRNGLNAVSAVDVVQVKSVSVDRFGARIGRVTPHQVNTIAEAIARCVGYDVAGEAAPARNDGRVHKVKN